MKKAMVVVPIVASGFMLSRGLIAPALRERIAQLPENMMRRMIDHMPESSP